MLGLPVGTAIAVSNPDDDAVAGRAMTFVSTGLRLDLR